MIRCYTGLNGTGANFDTPGTDKTGATSSVISMTCHGQSASIYVYTNTASTTLTANSQTLTITEPEEPVPNPTTGPHPTSTPPAAPPPPTTGSFATTSDCQHATRTVESGNVVCRWWTSDPDTTGDDPGSFFADFRFGGSPGIVEEPGGDRYRLRAPGPGTMPNIWGDLRTAIPVPAGYTAVMGAFGVNYGTAAITPSASGTWYVSIEFIDGAGRVTREVKVTHSASNAPTIMSSDTLAIPTGTVSVRLGVGCLTGTVCTGFYGSEEASNENRYIRLDAVALTWAPSGGTPPSGLPACNGSDVVTIPGFNNTCMPDWVIDPNTLAPVCGPISGAAGSDFESGCSKPFLAPLFVPVCNAPGTLDVVGWLSYIGCLLSTLPTVLANLGIFIANVLIDLIFPGLLDESFDYLKQQFETRALFSWVGPLGDAYGDALAAGPGGALDYGTVEFAGQTVDLGPALADAMDELAPFRDWMWAGIAIAFTIKLRNKVIGALNGSDVSEKAA